MRLWENLLRLRQALPSSSWITILLIDCILIFLGQELVVIAMLLALRFHRYRLKLGSANMQTIYVYCLGVCFVC